MTPCDPTSISSQQESCAVAKLPPAAEKAHATFCIRKIFYWKSFTNVNMRINLLMHPLGIDPQAHAYTYTHKNTHAKTNTEVGGSVKSHRLPPLPPNPRS